jgi:ADP-ribosyl-[dinitrogen reductase] hydrolase
MRHRSPYFEARALATSGQLQVRWHDWLGRIPAPISPAISLQDKVEGMMLGLAIGDSLGNTSESRNPRQRQATHGWIEHYLPNRYADHRAIGLPSDDTQLAARTLVHLLECKHLDPQLLGNRLAHGQIFGMGQATGQWVERFKQGVPWDQSGSLSAGNGALMRIAPVLIPRLRDPNCDLWAETLLAAHLTHDDELSNVSCVAMVDALWRAIGTTEPVPSGWWLQHWLEVCDALSTGHTYQARNGHPPGFDGTISQMLREHVAPALERELPVAEAGDIWHSGAYLLETVPTVVYILERYGNNPREAILQAVNHTRDNDTVAAIVGAAVGALHGASALPKAWMDDLSGRTAVDDDHQFFYLLDLAGQVFGHGSSPEVARRASLREASKPAARQQVKPPKPPKDLLTGELWFKVVEFLQQNWAVVRPDVNSGGTRIWFVNDGFGVFDYIDCESPAAARRALRLNGFGLYEDQEDRWVESEIPEHRTADKARKLTWAPRQIYSSRKHWIDP